jgi:DNA polymerase epsilon subunit 2
VLDEVAKTWKKNGGALIVEDGPAQSLKNILQNLEPCMAGGRIDKGRALSRQNSLVSDGRRDSLDTRPSPLSREDSQASLGMSSLDVGDEDDKNAPTSVRGHMQIISAYDHPRLVYNVNKKHFDTTSTPPSAFPPASHKTQFFRNRFNLVHQRLLRNESFQNPHFEVSRAPSLHRSNSAFTTEQKAYKLTPIANLLGRTGSSHLLFGLLTIAPTGELTISDLTGSIALDLQHARPVPEDGGWFAPGMIVLVDGVYEEEGNDSTLGGQGGVGGTIGGRFVGVSIGGPPCERREVTLGLSRADGHSELNVGGGFGWVDFLGVGSERAQGSRMRRIEQRVLGLNQAADDAAPLNSSMAIMSEVNLDNPRALEAVRKILGIYSAAPAEDMPFTIVMIGNFVQHAVMAGGGSGGSVEYKEYFDALASVLSEFPSLLQQTTFVFVPGDHDPWASAFSAGAATLIPRDGVPDLFTSRIRRAFASANAEAEQSAGQKGDGEAIWTTNPARISLFGPVQEIVIFRDDMSGRLRRSAIPFKPLHPPTHAEVEPEPQEPASQPQTQAQTQDADTNGENPTSPTSEMEVDPSVKAAESHLPSVPSPGHPSEETLTARKLVKTLLDQSFLSPFPFATRPTHWDYSSALSLYPLPTALVLADSEAPAFCVTYEGCHVVNPGRLVDGEGGRGRCRWIEYDVGRRKGAVREERL